MATDREIIKTAQAGHVGSAGCAADPLVEIKKMHQRTYTIFVQDAATAGTAVTETAIFTAPTACRVIGAKVVAPIAISNHATAIITVNVARERAAVSASISSDNTTTTTGTWPLGLAAFVAKTCTLSGTSANLDLVAGDTVTLAVVKGGAGQALVAATSYFQVQVTVEENGV